MTDVKVMSVTFLLPAGRSRDRDRFSHGSDVPYDYISQVVNNHEMIFDDEEEDTGGNDNPSISAQTHSSSKRNVTASVLHQSGPARRAIQANTSTLQDTSEAKHQEPEERGPLCMATHKTTKSNKQMDVNGAFSKAIEKKSTSQVSWDNDIEQPASQRHKKPQLQVHMASRKKVAFREDGALAGLGSSDEEENGPGEQTHPYQVIPGTQVTTPRVAVGTQSSMCSANRGANTQRGNTVGSGRGRGCGRTPGSHCFGAGGQSYWTEAPDGHTHLIPRSVHNAPPQPSVAQQHTPGVAATRNTHGGGPCQDGERQSYPITSNFQN